METHLYLVAHRIEALVASQLPPEQFGAYMAAGTKKTSRGDLMFFEVDPAVRNDYFDLSRAREHCKAHPDGRPKSSVYISIYRVIEHLPVKALGKLHLVTSHGRVLGISPAPYDASQEKHEPHLYEELCPVPPTVVSNLPPAAFVKFITDPANPIHVPRIFFADMSLARDSGGRLSGNLPYPRLGHIEECLRELEAGAGKKTKTVDRAPIAEFYYRAIRRGFFVGDQTEIGFYPFPSHEHLEREWYDWWRSAQGKT